MTTCSAAPYDTLRNRHSAPDLPRLIATTAQEGPMGDGYDIETRAVDMLALAICHHVREEECELTMRQIAVLLTVRYHPDAVGSIAVSLKVSDAAVSRAIDALQKHGFVRRDRLPESRTRVTVSITPKGKALVGRLLVQESLTKLEMA